MCMCETIKEGMCYEYEDTDLIKSLSLSLGKVSYVLNFSLIPVQCIGDCDWYFQRGHMSN